MVSFFILCPIINLIHTSFAPTLSILSKALQQYMLTNRFKPTVAELREIYAELVRQTICDWSEGWEKVSKAIGHYGMYQEEAAMESFDEVTREIVKRWAFRISAC